MEYYKSCFNVRFNNDNECMEINQAVTHIFPMVDKSDTPKEVTLTQGQKMKKLQLYVKISYQLVVKEE